MAEKLPRYYSQESFQEPSANPFGSPSTLNFGDSGLGEMAKFGETLGLASSLLAKQKVHADRVDAVAQATTGAAKEMTDLSLKLRHDPVAFQRESDALINRYAGTLKDPAAIAMFRKQIAYYAVGQYQQVAREAFQNDLYAKQGNLINQLAEFRSLAARQGTLEGLDYFNTLAESTISQYEASGVVNPYMAETMRQKWKENFGEDFVKSGIMRDPLGLYTRLRNGEFNNYLRPDSILSLTHLAYERAHQGMMRIEHDIAYNRAELERQQKENTGVLRTKLLQGAPPSQMAPVIDEWARDRKIGQDDRAGLYRDMSNPIHERSNRELGLLKTAFLLPQDMAEAMRSKMDQSLMYDRLTRFKRVQDEFLYRVNTKHESPEMVSADLLYKARTEGMLPLEAQPGVKVRLLDFGTDGKPVKKNGALSVRDGSDTLEEDLLGYLKSIPYLVQEGRMTKEQASTELMNTQLRLKSIGEGKRMDAHQKHMRELGERQNAK